MQVLSLITRCFFVLPGRLSVRPLPRRVFSLVLRQKSKLERGKVLTKGFVEYRRHAYLYICVRV